MTYFSEPDQSQLDEFSALLPGDVGLDLIMRVFNHTAAVGKWAMPDFDQALYATMRDYGAVEIGGIYFRHVHYKSKKAVSAGQYGYYWHKSLQRLEHDNVVWGIDFTKSVAAPKCSGAAVQVDFKHQSSTSRSYIWHPVFTGDVRQYEADMLVAALCV